MKRLTVLAIVLLSSSAVACIAGKDGAQGPAGPAGSSGGAGDPAGGAASSSGAPAGGAASSSGAPASSGGTDPAAAPTKVGSIIITQTSFTVADTQIDSYSAMASFVEATAAAPGANAAKCTVSKDGACDITVCDIPAPKDNDNGEDNPDLPEPKKTPSASDITITAADEITLSPDGKGYYEAMSGQSALFAAGDDVKIKAKGAEVPAFTKTIKAPAIVNVTGPEWPAPGDAFEIDRKTDLEITWDNGEAGDVQASISSVTAKKSTSISCKFKANAGTGKITKAALAKLVVSDTGSFSVSSSNSLAFDQSGWKMNVLLMSPATAGEGGMASGLAHIQ